MSFRIATALSLLALAAVTPLALTACGKQGPPMAPIRFIPRAADDLTVAQQGSELSLSFSFPSQSTSGTALPGLARAEVWQVRRPVAAERLGRSVYRAQVMRPLEAQEFAGAAESLAVFEGEDLQRVTAGDRIAARLSLGTQTSGVREVLYLAVRTSVDNRDVSAFSNQAVLLPQTPPTPPKGLDAVAGPKGIEISWTLAEKATGEGPAAGFHLYRRDPRSRNWGSPLAFAGPERRSFVDPEAVQGRSYIYTVTKVVQREPLVESTPGGAREVDYRDLFPPPVPQGLVALRDQGRVRLVWQESLSNDLAGYRIYRRRQGEEFHRASADPVAGLEFVDDEVSSGETVFYSVTAVDELGNESAPAEEITVEVP